MSCGIAIPPRFKTYCGSTLLFERGLQHVHLIIRSNPAGKGVASERFQVGVCFRASCGAVGAVTLNSFFVAIELAWIRMRGGRRLCGRTASCGPIAWKQVGFIAARRS